MPGAGPTRPDTQGGGSSEPGPVAIVDPPGGRGVGGQIVDRPDPIAPVIVPRGGFDGILTGVAQQIQHTVKPAAAAAVATAFGFPLVLMIAVLLFLLVQSRLDGRDPKLHAAPLTGTETILPFRDEDQL